MIRLFVGSEFNESQYFAVAPYVEMNVIPVIAEEQGLDDDEALIIADDDERILISNRTLMNAKRFQKFQAEGFMNLPRKSYQLLQWLVRHGAWNDRMFQWVETYPFCDLCVEENGTATPAPYVCRSQAAGDIHLCPYHKDRETYKVVAILFVKERNIRVPDSLGVL